MRRFITRRASGKSIATLENEALQRLQQQADSLIAQLTRQFADNIEAMQKQAEQSFAEAAGNASIENNGMNAANAKLFASLFNVIGSRPKVKTTQTESQRSRNASDIFRLSHSQMMVEAASTLQQGDKNR